MSKVLLVAPVPPPYGGIPHWTAMMLRHSQTDGRIRLQVIDIAPRHRSRFEMSFSRRVIRGIPGLISQIVSVIKSLPGKDVLALHVTTPGHYALVRDIGLLFLARIFRRKGILHIRIGRVPALLKSTGFESFILRLGLRVATHIIAIDKATAQAIRQSLPSLSVTRIPNCIDFSVLPDVPPRKAQTVLFVGWVIPAKGIEELLGAWARLARTDWHLKIIGPCSSEYATDLAARHELQGIEFTGEIDNSLVLGEMARAAILCLPSHTEGFPNVVLEAMALRCVVVATPVGAIPEMLADGAGVIVAETNEIELANRLLGVMDDPTASERIAEKANEKVRNQYTIESIYKNYEAIWQGADRA